MADEVGLRTPAYTVAQVEVELVGRNPNRRSLVIKNTGANTVTIKGGSGVVAGQAHALGAGDAYAISTPHPDVPCYKGAIFAISATGNNLVTVAEEG